MSMVLSVRFLLALSYRLLQPVGMGIETEVPWLGIQCASLE